MYDTNSGLEKTQAFAEKIQDIWHELKHFDFKTEQKNLKRQDVSTVETLIFLGNVWIPQTLG